MNLAVFAQGLVIGVTVAAPVGPMALLCLRRTLASGRAMGVVSGLGIATVDGVYSSVAAFGLTSISGFLIAQKSWIGLVGGLALCWIGLRMLRAPAVAPASLAVVPARGYAAAYASMVGLTLANPPTILLFAAIFAGLGALQGRGEALTLVTGVVVGSALWWIGLAIAVGALRERLAGGWMRWVNRLSGAMIAGFGLLSIASIVR